MAFDRQPEHGRTDRTSKLNSICRCAARYRERHGVSGAKSDVANTRTLADMVRTDSHRLSESPVDLDPFGDRCSVGVDDGGLQHHEEEQT